MKTHLVEFEPIGRRGQFPSGETLLSCAHNLGVGISSICGGQGVCDSCKIRLIEGAVSKPTKHELELFSSNDIRTGWRLACQTHILGDCKVSIPTESMTTVQRIQVEGMEVRCKLQPSVKTYAVSLTPPSLTDPRGDAERLLYSVNRKLHSPHVVDFAVLRTLPVHLRSWNWKCRVATRGKEVIGILPCKSRQIGLAVDLGTTKIAIYIIDLLSGKTLASKGILNPQINYGEDVVTRIKHASSSSEKARQLQQLVVEALNQVAAEMCSGVDHSIEDILDIVVVGNTAMHHLFLGLPVDQLARSPFVPAVSRSLDVKARELGLNAAAGAYVHLLPNIAGFVGADHVAALLGSNTAKSEGATLLIDIGTNTEISLIQNGKIRTVSCASGPAFEGGHIKSGMRAVPGAIERLRIKNGTVIFQTIGGVPPLGICGSGAVDALAQLYLAGIIDEGGKMSHNHPGVRIEKGLSEFVLIEEDIENHRPPIFFTQQDVREIQLAKAAIRTGIQVLLEAGGLSEEQINQVVLAGAFGNYIDISSAVSIGMLPALPLKRFRQIGNAAGIGAKLALISMDKRAQADHIASKVIYIELASVTNFSKIFTQATYLGRYRLVNGKRLRID